MNSFPCWLSPWSRGGGQACSLYGVRVGVCPGVRPEGWLRWFAHPLGGVLCRGHAQDPAFAPGSSKEAVGCIFFWVILYLLSRICPNSACTQLFSVPYSFFVFCCSKRGLSKWKHCSTAAKGPSPRLSHSYSTTFISIYLPSKYSSTIIEYAQLW